MMHDILRDIVYPFSYSRAKRFGIAAFVLLGRAAALLCPAANKKGPFKRQQPRDRLRHVISSVILKRCAVKSQLHSGNLRE